MDAAADGFSWSTLSPLGKSDSGERGVGVGNIGVGVGVAAGFTVGAIVGIAVAVGDGAVGVGTEVGAGVGAWVLVGSGVGVAVCVVNDVAGGVPGIAPGSGNSQAIASASVNPIRKAGNSAIMRLIVLLYSKGRVEHREMLPQGLWILVFGDVAMFAGVS